MSTQVSNPVDRIREVISKLTVAEEMATRRRSWLRLTSALDVIDDTECAIVSYEQHFGKPMQFASGYLQVYGVLQALVVQQDAVREVAKALNLPTELSPVLKEIRDVRNMAVGHPTSRFGGTSHYITRVSMRWEGFTLLTAGHESREQNGAIDVNLQHLIPTQRTQIAARLDRCAREIENKYPVSPSE
jgi:hypothetical protein